MSNEQCPVCTQLVKFLGSEDHGIKEFYSCNKCGRFGITKEAKHDYILEKYKNGRARLSYWLRNHQGGNQILLTTKLLNEIVQSTSLPKPKEQADNLLLWIGNKVNSPDEVIKEPLIGLTSLVGAIDKDGVKYIVEYLKGEKFIRHFGYRKSIVDGVFIENPDYLYARLTFLGWDRYNEFLHESKDSRTVFMAMKFGKKETDNLYKNVLKDAVSKTGFELRKLDDNPEAGLIDDRLRVEIRKGKFLIADLTHENPGAYFEAGFAEGLGKKVIYICEKKKFEKDKTHFDTNHSLTLTWDLENPKEFAEQLKATIRATFPTEAKMEDE